MKKFLLCLIITLLIAGVSWAKGFSSSGSHSFSSSSSSRSYSSTPIFRSYSSSSSNYSGSGYSSSSNRSYTINNYHSYGGGSYYGSGYMQGMLTGALLTSMWSHPYGVVVYGNQQFLPYNGGYVDQQGNFYQTLASPQQYQQMGQQPLCRLCVQKNKKGL